MMEILQPFNFTALSLVLLFSFIFLFFNKICSLSGSRSPKKSVNLPPSPPKLPIIGHLHHLVGRLPHHRLMEMAQKYGRVMHLQLGEISAVVISSREAAKEALKVQDPACADRPESIGTAIMWSSDMVFSPYNEYWRRMRKICILEILSAKNVKSFEAIRQDEVSRLVDSIRSSCGESIDITKKIFTYSSSMTSRATIGKVVSGNNVLIDKMKRAITMAGGFELADLFPSSKLLNALCRNKYKLLRMRREVDAILDAIVEEHELREKTEYGDEDIVDVLLRIKNNDDLEFPITNDNIKGIIYDLFSAGTDTSSTAMDWAMAELMRNPNVMAKLHEEVREAFKGKTIVEESDLQGLAYLKLVIKETLRLHPPVSLLPRACRDKCTVDGYFIPLKSKVIVNVWSMGRDPKYWDQPETFLPERFENSSTDYLGNNFEFIPFGAGRRMCPGMNFGIANLMLALSQLLYHFDWEMPKGMVSDDVDMTEADGITITRKNPLHLVPVVPNIACS